jgi:hypothetical protein
MVNGLNIRLAKLFEGGLIEEHQETTKTGRMRVIHLAAKGKALSSKSKFDNFIVESSMVK